MPSPDTATASVTIRVNDVLVATSISGAAHSAALEAERMRLKAGAGSVTAAEANALKLLEFIEELLHSIRDVRRDSHAQALEAHGAGKATYDAILTCPSGCGPTFGYLRQLFDQVDRLCEQGVLRVRPSTPEERDQRQRICCVLEAELASRDLVRAG